MHRLLSIVLAVWVVSCASRGKQAESPEPECRDDVGDDLKMAARTTGAGVKAGAKTGVEGVKTFGRATGGLFRGGSDEAKKEWRKGATETDHVASEGAAETRSESSVKNCP